MISRLRGRLWVKQPSQSVVDVMGVGYQVLTPLSTFYALPEAGQTVELFVRTQMTSENISLFGFLTAKERRLFDLLISVGGIGPRLALNILSGIRPDELFDALVSGDAVRLRAIPGVGKKTSERMIVELRDKVLAATLPELPAGAAQEPESLLLADAVSALINLGYKPAQAEQALNAARKKLSGEPSLENLIKEALRGLAL